MSSAAEVWLIGPYEHRVRLPFACVDPTNESLRRNFESSIESQKLALSHPTKITDLLAQGGSFEQDVPGRWSPDAETRPFVPAAFLRLDLQDARTSISSPAGDFTVDSASIILNFGQVCVVACRLVPPDGLMDRSDRKSCVQGAQREAERWLNDITTSRIDEIEKQFPHDGDADKSSDSPTGLMFLHRLWRLTVLAKPDVELYRDLLNLTAEDDLQDLVLDSDVIACHVGAGDSVHVWKADTARTEVDATDPRGVIAFYQHYWANLARLDHRAMRCAIDYFEHDKPPTEEIRSWESDLRLLEVQCDSTVSALRAVQNSYWRALVGSWYCTQIAERIGRRLQELEGVVQTLNQQRLEARAKRVNLIVVFLTCSTLLSVSLQTWDFYKWTRWREWGPPLAGLLTIGVAVGTAWLPTRIRRDVVSRRPRR